MFDIHDLDYANRSYINSRSVKYIFAFGSLNLYRDEIKTYKDTTFILIDYNKYDYNDISNIDIIKSNNVSMTAIVYYILVSIGIKLKDNIEEFVQQFNGTFTEEENSINVEEIRNKFDIPKLYSESKNIKGIINLFSYNDLLFDILDDAISRWSIDCIDDIEKPCLNTYLELSNSFNKDIKVANIFINSTKVPLLIGFGAVNNIIEYRFIKEAKTIMNNKPFIGILIDKNNYDSKIIDTLNILSKKSYSKIYEVIKNMNSNDDDLINNIKENVVLAEFDSAYDD